MLIGAGVDDDSQSNNRAPIVRSSCSTSADTKDKSRDAALGQYEWHIVAMVVSTACTRKLGCHVDTVRDSRFCNARAGHTKEKERTLHTCVLFKKHNARVLQPANTCTVPFCVSFVPTVRCGDEPYKRTAHTPEHTCTAPLLKTYLKLLLT